MKKVKFLSRVNRTKCTGDKLCESVCPTGAIKVINKKAVVDKKKCVACSKCWDVCQKGAIRMVPRAQPLHIICDQSDVDEAKIKEFCKKAHLYPDLPICVCTGTLAREAAAAIIKGCKSIEDLVLMTGAFSGCGIYCMEPIQRLFRANGVEITPPKGQQWHEIRVSLWDIPREIKQKYPGYFLEEDLKLYEKI
jgi:Fe-S-cluster-containing hydrogenase component 2